MKICKPFWCLLLAVFPLISVSAQETVWPGDVNNNGVVNEADLLFLGLGYGDSGPARKTVTTTWEQQVVSLPWETSAVPGLNSSFADCNGDGIVDANDIEAIKANYGRMHTDVEFIPDEIPLAVVGTDPSFSVAENANLNIFPNTQSISIPIHLGNDTLAVESLLGISFKIQVNGQAFDATATKFELSGNGWLPTNNSALITSEDLTSTIATNPEEYIVAYTKTDRVPSSGNGLIGEVILTPGFILEGDVPNLRVTIDSVILIDNQRNKTPVVGTEIILNPLRFLDSTSTTTTICQGENVEFNNILLTESGIYRDTLKNVFGGDSISILDLQVLPNSEVSLTETICQGETYLFAGDTLTQAGIYESVSQSFINGCDSTTSLQLTVLDTFQTVLERTICQGESFEFKGQGLTTSGTYRDTLAAANGCNQYIVLNLTVNDTLQTVIERTICQGELFAFNGQNLGATGAYRDTLTAANGCDQYVILNLMVEDRFQTMLTESICQGEAYLFANEAKVTSGVYEEVLQAANGCDSVVTLNLTVNDTATTTINQTICESASFDFNGQSLNTEGVYRDTLANVNGCDSFVVLALKIADRFETERNEVICVGESVAFNGQNIEVEGSYQQNFVAQNGCDSLVTLNLTVHPTGFTALSEEICAGSSRSFNGQDLSTTGTYLDTLTTVNGCDSIIELTISVAPILESTSEQTICAGDTIEFYTFILTETNSYTAMVKTAEGCDSMVILNLLVLDEIETTIAEQLCPQDTLQFGDQLLTEAGVYTQSLTSVNGCDSTVTLNLTMGVAGEGGCMSVSIEEAFLQSIEIYPNPVRQSLFINAPSVKLEHIRLINLTGQVLLERGFNNGNSNNQEEVNMQDLGPGVYWVLIQTEYGLRQEKIVKL